MAKNLKSDTLLLCYAVVCRNGTCRESFECFSELRSRVLVVPTIAVYRTYETDIHP